MPNGDGLPVDARDVPATAAVAEQSVEGAENWVASERRADGAAAEGAIVESSLPHPRVGRAIVFIALPMLALFMAAAAGFLKWEAGSMQAGRDAASESVLFATDTTIKMLSYRPDTVGHDLAAAQDRMTDGFRDDYAKLVNDVVIPGAREKKISAVVSVPAASSVSATADHAVVLVFVDQTVTVGADPPSQSASSIRMVLDKRAGRWLVSAFDPI